MMKPTLWRGKCLDCGKEFSYEDGFSCSKKPGNHRVAAMNFYHLGGRSLQNDRERRSWAPLVILDAPPDRMDPESKTVVRVPPITAQFQPSGIFTTDDPLLQFYLCTRSSCGWGEAGLKAWEHVYLTAQQRSDLAKAQLAETERKIKEANETLVEVQKRVAGNKSR